MNITPKYSLKIKQRHPDLTGKYKDIADNNISIISNELSARAPVYGLVAMLINK